MSALTADVSATFKVPFWEQVEIVEATEPEEIQKPKKAKKVKKAKRVFPLAKTGKRSLGDPTKWVRPDSRGRFQTRSRVRGAAMPYSGPSKRVLARRGGKAKGGRASE